MPCEIIPDFCFASARNSGLLASFDPRDVLLACQPRAARALLGTVTISRCVNLRTEPLADVLASLDLSPAGAPPEPVYEKLSSDWIPWFPVIDVERCVHCKKCVDFCMFGVYAVREGRVEVVRPEACKTDCPACARICPKNAIIFPKSEEAPLNGSLAEPVAPSPSDNAAFRERLQRRKGLRLFKEDEP